MLHLVLAVVYSYENRSEALYEGIAKAFSMQVRLLADGPTVNVGDIEYNIVSMYRIRSNDHAKQVVHNSVVSRVGANPCRLEDPLTPSCFVSYSVVSTRVCRGRATACSMRYHW